MNEPDDECCDRIASNIEHLTENKEFVDHPDIDVEDGEVWNGEY